MFIIRLIIWNCLILLLISCGGNDTKQLETDKNELYPAVTLNNLVGVWDSSRKIDNLIDEYYVVIKPNGSIVSYNYLGDSYDNLNNCYSENFRTIAEIGNGIFLVTDNEGYS